jgi:hypothetical protein
MEKKQSVHVRTGDLVRNKNNGSLGYVMTMYRDAPYARVMVVEGAPPHSPPWHLWLVSELERSISV